MPPRKWAASLDMYRKIPADFMEGTRRGSILSYFAVVVMLTLFVMETKEFFQSRLVTDLSLDSNKDKRIRVNFNITMMDLKCDFCVVDVVSMLGTEQNVTSHVTKWSIDGAGVRRRFQGRNRAQNDIDLHDAAVKETIEELHEDGEDAISLDAQTLEFARKEQQYLFVDFYANWCSHCRQLMPTWETLAEVMGDVADSKLVEIHGENHEYTDEEYESAKNVQLPVMIAKVDCVLHQELCQQQGIRAYPTLRLFVDGERWSGGDYRGHRTIKEFAAFLKSVEDQNIQQQGDEGKASLHTLEAAVNERMDAVSDEEREWADKVMSHRHRSRHTWVEEDHPGCQLSGHLLLDRAPGNFHIQARSAHHDLVPYMTNVSHEVHHLSVGEPIARRLIEEGKTVLPQAVKDKINPMDGNVYITHELHEAYHHYLKVVTTNVDGMKINQKDLRAYQILHNSQLAYYRNDIVPEAKFTYDLSPIAVSYRFTSRRWYDFLTSVMAIVGGTFTVVGLIESSIHAVVARKKRY